MSAEQQGAVAGEWNETDAARALSAKAFARVAQYIRAELGIRMPDTKRTMVQSRLLRRVRSLGLESVEHYCEQFLANGSSSEREFFINAITTNKTDFFREPEHFQFLTSRVLPALGRQAGSGPSRFKVWSAGCSTGEEPYTLAMVLSEWAAEHTEFDFVVLGTDVSTRVLGKAREGIYSPEQVDPVPLEMRRKYLGMSRSGTERLVRVMPQLRAKTVFHPLNFMDSDYGIQGLVDAVFFRNVMIYFDKETQAAVIRKICRHLAPGGYLFAGRSESLFGLDIPVVQTGPSVHRKPECG